MPSSIDIASNALLLVGDNAISSFEDAGAGAQVAASLYPEIKKELLSEHPWSFATKKQRLNRLSQAPDELTDYKYAFQLPTDLIRLWSLDKHINYEIVGNLLYSNEKQLLATYIYDVDEVNLPPHFVKLLLYALAEVFSIPIAESEAKSQLYEGKTIRQKGKAMNIDSQGRPQQSIIDSPLIDARRGGLSAFGRF